MSEHDETRDVATKRGAVEAARQEERRTPIQPLPDTEAAPRPSAATHRGAADIGYLRAIYENAPRLAEMHPGDYGPITPLTREIILSLLDELEAKLDAS